MSVEQLLAEALQACKDKDEQKVDRVIRQMIAVPEEVLPELLRAMMQPGKARLAMVIHAFHLMGFPQNKAAIPQLIYHIGDLNFPGWMEAARTLIEMDPDAVVPHLIRALLDNGRPYHFGTWSYDVDGICNLLTMNSIDPVYAIRCCPAINYILCHENFSEDPSKVPDMDYLLDVIEKAGNEVHYVIPALIYIAKNHKIDEMRTRASELLASFPPGILSSYQLLLPGN